MTPERGFESIIQSYKGQRTVSAGKMFASHGLKVNGKIFAMLYKGTLVVKLPAARADQLTFTRGGEYFQLGKKVMREWVVVHAPPGTSWKKFAAEAKEFVGSQKTKRTTS